MRDLTWEITDKETYVSSLKVDKDLAQEYGMTAASPCTALKAGNKRQNTAT